MCESFPAATANRCLVQAVAWVRDALWPRSLARALRRHWRHRSLRPAEPSVTWRLPGDEADEPATARRILGRRHRSVWTFSLLSETRGIKETWCAFFGVSATEDSMLRIYSIIQALRFRNKSCRSKRGSRKLDQSCGSENCGSVHGMTCRKLGNRKLLKVTIIIEDWARLRLQESASDRVLKTRYFSP